MYECTLQKLNQKGVDNYMNNIKKIRVEKGIPVKYISYISKISISYIYLLENNKRKNPSLNTMKDIAKALEEPITEVFYNE